MHKKETRLGLEWAGMERALELIGAGTGAEAGLELELDQELDLERLVTSF